MLFISGIIFGHLSSHRLIAIEDQLLRICVLKDSSYTIGISCCEATAWEWWFGPFISDQLTSCKLAVNKNLSDIEILNAERQCDDTALKDWEHKRGFVPDVSSDLFNVGDRRIFFILVSLGSFGSIANNAHLCHSKTFHHTKLAFGSFAERQGK